MCEVPRHRATSAFDNREHYESDEEPGISAFGFPKTNHGWVECASKSFPGQTYFFNVDTCCSTWHRPVSRFVPTRMSRPLALLSDDDFLNVAPIEVSDIEDENDYEDDEDWEIEHNLDLPPDADDVKPPTFARDAAVSVDSKIYAQVLFKLYHCYSRDAKDNEIDDDVAPLDCETFDDDASDNFASIQPEICYSSDSDGSRDSDSDSEATDAELETISKEEGSSETSDSLETSENDESFVEVPREDAHHQFSELDCLKVLQTNDSDDESMEKSLDISESSATDSDVGSRQMGLSSDDDEEDEEDEENHEDDEKYKRADENGHFSLPRLKAIGYEDLSMPRKLRKKRSKKRKSNMSDDESNRAAPTSKMIKIVCEVNGVTTVNYDSLPPDLPAGVKMSNLSDSGSSACYDAWYARRDNEDANNNRDANERVEAAKSFGILDEPINLSDPDLSDSSTSSSSSASSASSSEVRRNRARKMLEEAQKLIDQANESLSSSKSPSDSANSSWKWSGDEEGDDDDD